MTVVFAHITFDSVDAKALATFWAKSGELLWYATVNAIVAFEACLVRLSTTSALITSTAMSLVNRFTTSSTWLFRRRSA